MGSQIVQMKCRNIHFKLLLQRSNQNLLLIYIYFCLWVIELMEFYVSGNSTTIMALAGNKSDLLESRQVSSEVCICVKNSSILSVTNQIPYNISVGFGDLWVHLLIQLVLSFGLQLKLWDLHRPNGQLTVTCPLHISKVSLWQAFVGPVDVQIWLTGRIIKFHRNT